MTRFYLARHGQTAWNKEERFRGRKDVPLSDRGREEAGALAEALSKEKIDHLFSGPLDRCKQTFAPLSEALGLEVKALPDVIDMDFGEWEGLKIDEAREKYPDMFEAWRSEPHTVEFPGGESLPKVQARAMRAVSRLAANYPDQAVAVCSHRVVTKLIILGVLGARADRFWVVRQDTACLNVFDYDPPHAVIHSMNDTHHLSVLPGRLNADF